MFLNNLSFFMICINLKKNFRKISAKCHLYSILISKKNFQKNFKMLCYAAEQIYSLVFNYENMH